MVLHKMAVEDNLDPAEDIDSDIVLEGMPVAGKDEVLEVHQDVVEGLVGVCNLEILVVVVDD